jgi:hypothetical protein
MRLRGAPRHVHARRCGTPAGAEFDLVTDLMTSQGRGPPQG